MNDKSRRLVLIVDDQEINRDLLSLILLDLMMPVMDGFQVLEAVHNDEALRRIPIIVLTAEKSAELKALQMGAADFITKPFDLYEIILARADRIIELNESQSVIRTAERDELTGLYTQNFFFPYCARILRYHPEWELDAAVLNVEHFHLLRDVGCELIQGYYFSRPLPRERVRAAHREGAACEKRGMIESKKRRPTGRRFLWVTCWLADYFPAISLVSRAIMSSSLVARTQTWTGLSSVLIRCSSARSALRAGSILTPRYSRPWQIAARLPTPFSPTPAVNTMASTPPMAAA